MKSFLDSLSGFFVVCALGFSPVLALALDRPESGVSDRASVLSLPLLKATERILDEHQRLTQETVFVVTEAESPEKGIEDEASLLLESWKAETPRPANVVVIAVDAKSGKLSVHTGIGLDGAFGAHSERVKEIRDVYFTPEWKNGKPYRALVLAIVETLRSLDSPLVTSGEAVAGYEHAGFSGGWSPMPPAARTSTTWIWFVVGAIVFAFALYRTLAIEVHTTGEGWRRIPVSEVLSRRLRKNRAPALITGGGVSGNY